MKAGRNFRWALARSGHWKNYVTDAGTFSLTIKEGPENRKIYE